MWAFGTTKKCERIESYDPQLVENIIQAISGDILCYALQTLRHCSLVMNIHNEVVIEADSRMNLDLYASRWDVHTPGWWIDPAANGYITEFYEKD